MVRSLRYWGVVTILILLGFYLSIGYAQEDTQLRLVSVDSTAFPVVKITLLTADANSAPVDLSALALRENGAPITDLTFSKIPSGIDVTFVLDANVGFNEIDSLTGLTRRDNTIESINRFTRQFMNPDGLDSVSIVVPDDDGESGRFLVSEITKTEDIAEALNEYNPRRLNPTPLNAMLTLALEQAQLRKENGRFQAVLLFTDGRRLDQQLSFLQLVAQANDAIVPIYSAILGEAADPNEIDNVSRLSDPTRAFYVHMPEPEATDSIYQIWQEQSDQVQVQYRSRQRQSGRNQLTLNLGSALISTDFEVTLAAPEVDLTLDNINILRAGTAPETPLEALQPTLQPVGINLMWPDELPRQITDITLLVDGQSVKPAAEWQEETEGRLELLWDISSLEDVTVDLVVEVTDELGYKGKSEPLVIDIMSDRPLPPTPVPTVEPQEPVLQKSPVSWLRWDLLAGSALLFFLFLIGLLWRRRRISAKKALAAKERENVNEDEDQSIRTDDGLELIATLESVSSGQKESFAIKGENVTIGSQAQTAQIVLTDVSVSHLHARIRIQDFEYWLFDEGGSEGTFLNYEKVGLAPQKLSNGDIVQFGKATFRFHLQQVVDLQ